MPLLEWHLFLQKYKYEYSYGMRGEEKNEMIIIKRYTQRNTQYLLAHKLELTLIKTANKNKNGFINKIYVLHLGGLRASLCLVLAVWDTYIVRHDNNSTAYSLLKLRPDLVRARRRLIPRARKLKSLFFSLFITACAHCQVAVECSEKNEIVSYWKCCGRLWSSFEARAEAWKMLLKIDYGFRVDSHNIFVSLKSRSLDGYDCDFFSSFQPTHQTRKNVRTQQGLARAGRQRSRENIKFLRLFCFCLPIIKMIFRLCQYFIWLYDLTDEMKKEVSPQCFGPAFNDVFRFQS